MLKKQIKILLFLFIFMFITNSSFGATTEEVKQNIINQAKAMNVEPAIVLSIAKTESGFRQNVTGAGGHIGGFQLSGATAKNLGVNPYNLDDNIKGGITYYKNMYNKFGSMELAVAAYNLGPEAISRRGNTIPNYTKPFVSRIMNDYKNYKQSGL